MPTIVRMINGKYKITGYDDEYPTEKHAEAALGGIENKNIVADYVPPKKAMDPDPEPKPKKKQKVKRGKKAKTAPVDPVDDPVSE